MIRNEKAHEHKQIFLVTARGGVSRPAAVSRPVARCQKFMCCVRNQRNINIFVWVPGREDTRPGGSVTGVTEQLFMCLFRPLDNELSNFPVNPNLAN